MRKRILKIYAVALSVGFGYFLLVGPLGIPIPCFYYTTTGWLCPGCGTSRMFLSLLRLDIAGAFAWNPVMFCLLIFWNAVAALCFWGKPRLLQKPRVLCGCLAVTVLALLVYCLLRNLH